MRVMALYSGPDIEVIFSARPKADLCVEMAARPDVEDIVIEDLEIRGDRIDPADLPEGVTAGILELADDALFEIDAARVAA